MKKTLKWIGGGLLAIVVLAPIIEKLNKTSEPEKTAAASVAPSTASQAPPPQFDPLAIRVVKAFMVDDLKGWSEGGEAMLGDWHAQNMNSPIKITAIDLSRKYNANEVAADNEFRNKTLWITGKVDAISKNAFDKPYLALRGAEMFREVHAVMDKSAYEQIATYKKGQSVSLICRGAGMTLMSPIATECITLGSALGKAELKIANWVDSFFAGKADGSSELKSTAAMIYVSALHLPADSSCHKMIDKACEKDLERIFTKKNNGATREEVKSQYDAMKDYLKLPPFPDKEARPGG
jgi:hypothetical protein